MLCILIVLNLGSYLVMTTHGVVQEAWKTFSLLDMFAEIRFLQELHKKQLISIPKHLLFLQLENLVLKRIIQKHNLMSLEIFALEWIQQLPVLAILAVKCATMQPTKKWNSVMVQAGKHLI